RGSVMSCRRGVIPRDWGGWEWCGHEWSAGLRQLSTCLRVGPGMAGGRGTWRSSCSWGCGAVTGDGVPQGFPRGLPWPVRGQVQRRLAGGGGEAGGHGDQVPAQGGAARDGVVAAGDGPGGTQQIV